MEVEFVHSFVSSVLILSLAIQLKKILHVSLYKNCPGFIFFYICSYGKLWGRTSMQTQLLYFVFKYFNIITIF